MDALYARGGTAEWESAERARADWHLIAGHLKAEFADRAYRILDLGCYDGGFLRSLEGNARKSGIEMNAKASAVAREQGIEIVGGDVDSFRPAGELFDAAVSMDVIEHVKSPAAFLKVMAGVVKVNGIVVISTGNTDAWTWRLMGSHYWYCAFGEHISFVSPAWCRATAPSCGLEVERVEVFSHRSDAGLTARIKELGYNLSYRLFPAGWRWLRKSGYGGHDVGKKPELIDYPPAWLSARDHFVCVFRKVAV